MRIFVIDIVVMEFEFFLTNNHLPSFNDFFARISGVALELLMFLYLSQKFSCIQIVIVF